MQESVDLLYTEIARWFDLAVEERNKGSWVSMTANFDAAHAAYLELDRLIKAHQVIPTAWKENNA